MAGRLLKVQAAQWERELDREQVEKAAKALIAYIAESKTKSKNLLEENAEWINLVCVAKVILQSSA